MYKLFTINSLYNACRRLEETTAVIQQIEAKKRELEEREKELTVQVEEYSVQCSNFDEREREAKALHEEKQNLSSAMSQLMESLQV